MNSFEIRGGHCRLTFKNGYTVSLYNGFGSYSDNKFDTNLLDITADDDVASTYCEVAIIKNGKFVTRDVIGDDTDVIGYESIDDVLDILNKVSKL